jgi:succinylarginine dihydrolase
MMIELQLQGLVGPTHNYAGLGLGNVASKTHAGRIANPRGAALQSLQLMRWLLEHEVPVAILPPQSRPRLDVLETLGFSSPVADQLQAAMAQSPQLLRAIWSSSFMWSANAATATSLNGELHVTPANLISSLHRKLEAYETAHFLQQILPFAIHHAPLNVTSRLPDEGAANHMHLCREDGSQALHLFIYGAAPPDSPFPKRFMPRQNLAASEAVAENHQLPPEHCLFFQQNPHAIDAGVFHHDVIALSHRNLLVIHEKSLLNQPEAIEKIRANAPWLTIREVSEAELPLEQAVKTYFFNAQLVTMADASTAVLFPQECAQNAHTKRLADELGTRADISHVGFWDLRESMQNGGGPACLRLRVPMTDAQLSEVHAGARLNIKKIMQLERFIETRYRDHVSPDDLLDAEFAREAAAVQADVLKLLNITPWR